MPDANKVRAMLGILFDGLDVRRGKRFEVEPASHCWVGVYVADDGAPVAACIADRALAANASAALSMLPPAVARDAAILGSLSDGMVENLHEVLNICSRLLMNEGCQHLKLKNVYPAEALPKAVARLFAAQKGRVDFELDFPKYGPGTLAVVST
jgi:hypothetical protein